MGRASEKLHKKLQEITFHNMLLKKISPKKKTHKKERTKQVSLYIEVILNGKKRKQKIKQNAVIVVSQD